MKTLFIVDAVNFLFRAYYAIGPMTNPKGESTNALYGFIRSINKLIKDFSPEHFIAVFDGPQNKQARVAIYKEYKSHRASMPEDLFSQWEYAVEFCDRAGISSLAVPGVEADDTIGSIAKWADKHGTHVFICSSDKDLCQLVTDRIHVINPHKDNLVIDKHKVKELFGVNPEQFVDFLALTGDASDNIPGVEGIGPKTAVSFLEEFGSLDRLYTHLDKLPEKRRETLIKGKENAFLSRELARIQLDVDFPKDPDFFRLKPPKLEKLKELYHEMHFLSLLKELGSQESEKTSTETNYQLIDEEKKLIELVKHLQKEKQICVDVETTDIRPIRAKLVGIGLGVHAGKAWYIPMNGQLGKQKALALLKPLLEDTEIGFIGHNIKYDLHVLLNEGIHVQKIAFDTILASYLISPNNQRHNLDELALEKFGKVKIPIESLIGKGKNQLSMDVVPLDKITEYCCEDVDYTLRLKSLFEKELKHLNLTDLFHNIELPLVPILMRMERNGIFVDVKKLQKMSEILGEELKKLEEEIYQLAGETFNINSPKQLGIVLFEKLQIRALKKTTTGYSTAADVLESLKDEAPIVKMILSYRTLEKLRSTYVDALPEQIFPETERIHCTFNQSVAATGRLSCQDPNLQNIPIRTSEGRKIREAFRPQHPHFLYVSADYSQIELRLLAHLSEDPVLMKAFQEGDDIHTYTASLVFNVPMDQVDKQMRSAAKAVNFGIIYGQQAFRLSQELGISVQDASSFIKTYFERYPKVKEFLEFCKESVRKTKRAVTLTGRQRPIPEIDSPNAFIRAQAERLAVNTPLQGTQADLIKMAMIEVDKILVNDPKMGMMILQIHDQLLFESPEGIAHSLAQKVKKIMETIVSLKVPLVVDISFGKNWSEC